ncbi:hypothetical protein MRB53_020527 [Persea americana]|uniref:Uncharacterized protein n=1 Tax=Persea americana TaxID=3435 RepID=A0ACC2L1M4_PERAE|nr:hypothetical protein MRB53_020527 [Persea americana]
MYIYKLSAVSNRISCVEFLGLWKMERLQQSKRLEQRGRPTSNLIHSRTSIWKINLPHRRQWRTSLSH